MMPYCPFTIRPWMNKVFALFGHRTFMAKDLPDELNVPVNFRLAKNDGFLQVVGEVKIKNGTYRKKYAITQYKMGTWQQPTVVE